MLHTFIQVCERLGLSYRSSQQLNNIINSSLFEIPRFRCNSVVMDGEVFELYSRNIIDCIKSLFGDPEFAPHLFLAPERHYEDVTMTNKIVHEMNTCRWWWNTQVGQTIIVYPANALMIIPDYRKL
jgi:Plavaka transposase